VKIFLLTIIWRDSDLDQTRVVREMHFPREVDNLQAGMGRHLDTLLGSSHDWIDLDIGSKGAWLETGCEECHVDQACPLSGSRDLAN